MNRHEILSLDTEDERIYYVEGNSAVLGAGLIDGEHNEWFCFEEPFVKAAMELQKLGFTATQILEAQTKLVDSRLPSDDFDDRPWGEQQGQVDWLESRFDIPGENGDERDFFV